MITIRPPETLIHFGATNIYTYGVILAIAILVGYLWAERRAVRAGIDRGTGGEVLFWAIIGGLIGARLGFVAQDVGYYVAHLTEILAIRNGGLSFHGALIGGVIGGGLALRHWRISQNFWRLADAASAPILLGAIIGRLGNWANQELYGYPASQPWGIAIDASHRLPGYERFTSFHPTFAYEAIINLIGVLILVFIIEKRAYRLELKTYGLSFAFIIAWYGLARGVTEIWRISDRAIGPLSLAQLISLVMIALGIWLYIRQKKTSD